MATSRREHEDALGSAFAFCGTAYMSWNNGFVVLGMDSGDLCAGLISLGALCGVRWHIDLYTMGWFVMLGGRAMRDLW